MNYIPTTYSVLDNVTATKLNKLENAVANTAKNFVVLEMIDNNNSLQTVNTFQEIYNYISNGIIVFFRVDGSQEYNAYSYFQLYNIDLENLSIIIQDGYDIITLLANSINNVVTEVIVT